MKISALILVLSGVVAMIPVLAAAIVVYRRLRAARQHPSEFQEQTFVVGITPGRVSPSTFETVS